MTTSGIPAGRRIHLSKLVADSARYFSRDSQLFNLFIKRNNPDLLFKDSTTGLKVIPPGTTYEEVLGSRFLEASKAVDPKECA